MQETQTINEGEFLRKSSYIHRKTSQQRLQKTKGTGNNQEN